ncbi:MAG: phosphoenolpyruvate--protein phosphotransferase [Lachnospiraceae bacterium]|nr:phosphoenolpyruvate--protein phosphotransferase [Candidatus Merdinaster equi]
MYKISGKAIYDGIEIGKAYFMRKARRSVFGGPCLSVQEEEARFFKALKKANLEIEELKAKTMRELGCAYSQIFEAYSVLLNDVVFSDCVTSQIRIGGIRAEEAIETAASFFYQKVSAVEDSLIKSRAQDILDVAERVSKALEEDNEGSSAPVERCILVVENLTPSDAMMLDKTHVIGIVLKEGTFDSHVAILMRNLGIPTIICPDANDKLHGKRVIIDSVSGCVVVEPDTATISLYLDRQQNEIRRKEKLQSLKGKPNRTRSGRSIEIYANIGDVRDLTEVIRNDAGGVGLFRSEFLYMGKDDFPTEEEQFEAYKLAATVMDGKPVVIRTLDIGADKRADYFKLDDEDNPALGKRAIRLCLERQEMFLSQLRAILRASAYGNVSILFPMITSVSELDKIEALMTEARHQLARDGYRFGSPTQGIMIETPASAMISDILAKRVDFFSIGTNDLSQYMLALDRQNASLGAYFDPYHEAVLRMIRMVTENAHKEGIRVSVCGELGADRHLTEFFINTGVDELSVSPAFILSIRKNIMEME